MTKKAIRKLGADPNRVVCQAAKSISMLPWSCLDKQGELGGRLARAIAILSEQRANSTAWADALERARLIGSEADECCERESRKSKMVADQLTA